MANRTPTLDNNITASSASSSLPNPLPPPPTSSSRRSSSTSFPRSSPDRVVIGEDMEGEITPTTMRVNSLLASPGASSNISTGTTTTLDIPDEFDIPDATEGMNTETGYGPASGISTSATTTIAPPMYNNEGSTIPLQPPPPPVYYPGELPPAYQVAAALPTYEEAELTKGN